MKTIYLMRHSLPSIKNNELLSREGIKALRVLGKKITKPIRNIYASEISRAVETAIKLYPREPVLLTKDLNERIIHDQSSFTKEMWEKQYLDGDFKDEGGESFNDVRLRFRRVIEMILNDIQEEETVLIVSHAAAICAYLQSFAEVSVISASEKIRRITFNERIVFEGKIKRPSFFEIIYEGMKVKEITYYE